MFSIISDEVSMLNNVKLRKKQPEKKVTLFHIGKFQFQFYQSINQSINQPTNQSIINTIPQTTLIFSFFFHFNFFIHGNPLRYTVLQGAMQIQNLIITKIFNPIYNNLSQKKNKKKKKKRKENEMSHSLVS